MPNLSKDIKNKKKKVKDSTNKVALWKNYESFYRRSLARGSVSLEVGFEDL